MDRVTKEFYLSMWCGEIKDDLVNFLNKNFEVGELTEFSATNNNNNKVKTIDIMLDSWCPISLINVDVKKNVVEY